MSLIDNSRPDMNKLRKTIMNAQDEKVISAEEAGFIVTIANFIFKKFIVFKK